MTAEESRRPLLQAVLQAQCGQRLERPLLVRALAHAARLQVVLLDLAQLLERVVPFVDDTVGVLGEVVRRAPLSHAVHSRICLRV
jgi:hypothetical protein